MTKISINDSIRIEYSWNNCGKKRNLSVWAISSFATIFSKVVCCRCTKMRQNMGKVYVVNLWYLPILCTLWMYSYNQHLLFSLQWIPCCCFLAHLSFAQGELLWSPFVRCLLCVVCQLLLLSNQWVNWDETSQKASSQWPHRISFKFWESMQNSSFHGNEMKKTSKFFCSQTGWQIFK